MSTELITTVEAASLIGWPVHRVARGVRTGLFPPDVLIVVKVHLRNNRTLRFDREKLTDWASNYQPRVRRVKRVCEHGPETTTYTSRSMRGACAICKREKNRRYRERLREKKQRNDYE